MLSLQIAWPCQSLFLPLDNMWPLPISPYILLLTVSPGISFGLCSSTPKAPSSVPLSILRLESTLGDLTILRMRWSPLEETHQWHGSKINIVGRGEALKRESTWYISLTMQLTKSKHDKTHISVLEAVTVFNVCMNGCHSSNDWVFILGFT